MLLIMASHVDNFNTSSITSEWLPSHSLSSLNEDAKMPLFPASSSPLPSLCGSILPLFCLWPLLHFTKVFNSHIWVRSFYTRFFLWLYSAWCSLVPSILLKMEWFLFWMRTKNYRLQISHYMWWVVQQNNIYALRKHT